MKTPGGSHGEMKISPFLLLNFQQINPKWLIVNSHTKRTFIVQFCLIYTKIASTIVQFSVTSCTIVHAKK